jgi:predicted nucleotidyltransferase/DNA-binding XRE family transcriptional regulator
MDVASLIRGARRAAGLSQSDLAERAGTSQPALARYETGVTMPTLPTLERLLRACGRRLELRVEDTLGARSLRRTRGRLLEAARAHGVSHVRVFGSLARGEATEGSDVDLLVDLDAGHTLLDLLSFQIAAESILDTNVDVATPGLLKDHVRERALREAVPL